MFGYDYWNKSWKCIPGWFLFCFILLVSSNVYAQQESGDSFTDQQAAKMLLIDGGMKELQGDLEGALADYSKLLEQEPNNIEALLQIGLVKNNMGPINAGEQSIQSALRLIEEGLKRDSNDANMYYLRGRAKRYLKDYSGAIEDTKKAIELNPQKESYVSVLKIIEAEGKLEAVVNKLETTQ